MAHSFIELYKPLSHDKPVIHAGVVPDMFRCTLKLSGLPFIYLIRRILSKIFPIEVVKKHDKGRIGGISGFIQ